MRRVKILLGQMKSTALRYSIRSINEDQEPDPLTFIVSVPRLSRNKAVPCTILSLTVQTASKICLINKKGAILAIV